jgi:hypothetical protein
VCVCVCVCTLVGGEDAHVAVRDEEESYGRALPQGERGVCVCTLVGEKTRTLPYATKFRAGE